MKLSETELKKYRRSWAERLQQEEKIRHQEYEKRRQVAAACARLLAKEYGVRQVYLLGSLTNFGRFRERSDIDLAVKGLREKQHFEALSKVWKLLPPGLELDLIPIEDASPELKEKIKQEGELLYEK